MTDSMINLLFRGGIIGTVFFMVLGIVYWIIMRHKGKELLKIINKEYE